MKREASEVSVIRMRHIYLNFLLGIVSLCLAVSCASDPYAVGNDKEAQIVLPTLNLPFFRQANKVYQGAT
jgi:hypothetical protein